MLFASEHTVLPVELHTDIVNSFSAVPGMLDADLPSPAQVHLPAIASSDDCLARILSEMDHTAAVPGICAPAAEDVLLVGGVDDDMYWATGLLRGERFYELDREIYHDFFDDDHYLYYDDLFDDDHYLFDDDHYLYYDDLFDDDHYTVRLPWIGGDTLATALPITLRATPRTLTDWVGSTDIQDYYRFTLTQNSAVDLALTGLRADADLVLFDRNGYAIASSRNSGAESERIAQTLNAGTYFIGVQQRSGSTFYNLTAAAVPNLPVVTIQATDAQAAETNFGQTPKLGRFTLTRTGSTTNPLTVNYIIGGTAINGVDYAQLTGTVTFAAGSNTAFIDINPINDNLVEPVETVVLVPLDSATYQVGASNMAMVTIADNDVLPVGWFNFNLGDEQFSTTIPPLVLGEMLRDNDITPIFRNIQDEYFDEYFMDVEDDLDGIELVGLRAISTPDYERVLLNQFAQGSLFGMDDSICHADIQEGYLDDSYFLAAPGSVPLAICSWT